MAIYYVDPYINSALGGIQGTVTSIRNGTWTDPFSAADIFNASATITAINGITIVNGDEIRFKGLATLDDFVYGTIQTNNGPNYYTRNIPSGANQTTFSAWKTALNTNIGSYRGVFFVSDTNHSFLYDNIASTDIPKGLFVGQTTVSTSTTQVLGVASNYFSLGSIFQAFLSTNLYLKLIKPTHIVKLTTTNGNFLNLSANVTYSAGWTSEATQDGQTILALMLNGSSTSRIGNSSTSVNSNLNLARLHFFKGSYSTDNSSTTQCNWEYLSSSYTHYFGTISAANNNAWSYFYYYGRNSKSNTNFKIGVYCDYYTQYFLSSNGTNHAITMANCHGGVGHYRFQDNTTAVTIGNNFIFTQYTDSAMFYYASSTTSTVTTVLNNSYFYAGTQGSMPNLQSRYQGTFNFLGNAYNFQDAAFQTAIPSATGSGPLVASKAFPLGSNSSQAVKIKLNPAVWYLRRVFSAFGSGADTTYLYVNTYGQINSNMGVLDTEGVDYKTTNSFIPIQASFYLNSGTWNDYNYTFESNTFDKKLISTALIDTNSVGQSVVPLLCYNDNNNNLVIQCNSNSAIDYHTKRVSLGYIDRTGKTSISVSAKIAKNINFGSAGVICNLSYKNTSGNESVLSLGVTYDSVNLTYNISGLLNFSSVSTDSGHFGLIFRVLNTSTGYTNTYTIKDIEYTVV